MSEFFFEALSGELNKEASMRSVRAAVRRAMRRGKKARTQAKRGAGLKHVIKTSEDLGMARPPPPPPPKPTAMPPAPKAQTMEQRTKKPKPLTPIKLPNGATKAKPMPAPAGTQAVPLNKTSAESQGAGDMVRAILEDAKKPGDAFTDSNEEIGVDDPRFGGGAGLKNLKGRQAPAFTDKINPTDMPGAFKGAGARDMAASALQKAIQGILYGGEKVTQLGQKMVKHPKATAVVGAGTAAGYVAGRRSGKKKERAKHGHGAGQALKTAMMGGMHSGGMDSPAYGTGGAPKVSKMVPKSSNSAFGTGKPRRVATAKGLKTKAKAAANY